MAFPDFILLAGGVCVYFHVTVFYVYSIQSDCTYVLVRDAVASTFSVVYGVRKCESRTSCRFINILVEDFVYELDTKGDSILTTFHTIFVCFTLSLIYAANGEPYVRKGDQSVTLPNQMDGLLFERVANFVIVQAEGLGFTVKWDTKV